MNYEYEIKKLFDFTVLKAEIINFASQEAIELLTYWVTNNLHEIPLLLLALMGMAWKSP